MGGMGELSGSASKISGHSGKPAPGPISKKPDMGKGIVEGMSPPQIKTRPADPKAALQFDIEQERERIKKMEDEYRKELDKLRNEQARAVGELEADHILAKKKHE